MTAVVAVDTSADDVVSDGGMTVVSGTEDVADDGVVGEVNTEIIH